MSPAVRRPATPAAKPLRTYTVTRTRRVGMLERLAASGFPPTAYSHRPQTSLVVSTRHKKASPATTKVKYGSQWIDPAPDRLHDRRHPRMRGPVGGPQREASRTMLSVASVTMNGCGTRP